jgi:hypothetical protein
MIDSRPALLEWTMWGWQPEGSTHGVGVERCAGVAHVPIGSRAENRTQRTLHSSEFFTLWCSQMLDQFLGPRKEW